MPVFVRASGLKDYQRFLQIAPKVVPKAAALALNDTARGKAGMRAIRAMMAEQVQFPRSYLTDRIGIDSYASPENLKVSIAARERPTSLARFIIGKRPARATRPTGRQKLKIQVKPGHTIDLGRAFLIKLRGGADSVNEGLAIRLKPGERILHKRLDAKPLGTTGLYLLYGPSVDQVFQTVALDVVPGVLEELQRQFLRQFTRLSGGAGG